MLGPADVLGDDEEVRGEALVADDLVLELETLADVDAADLTPVPIIAVALGEAFLALATELALMGLARVEQRIVRQDDAVPVELDVALLGDLDGVVAGLGAIREQSPHLLLGLHVELRTLHADAVRVVDLGVRADTHDDVLDRRVLAREVVEIVGCDDLDAHLLGDLDEGTGKLLVGDAGVGRDAVLLDLDVEIARLERVAEGLSPLDGGRHLTAVDALGDDAGDTRGAGDEALAMTAQVVQRHARLVVKALHGGLGDRLHEVDVALLVLGEEHHVVELGLAVARKGLVGGEIHLATEDGLDDQRRLELVDIALLVPHREVLHVLLVTARIGLLIGALELVATALLQEGFVVAPDLVLGRAVVHGVAGETELGDTVHVAVVGNGHGGHAQLDGARHHVLDARRAVQHGIDGVVVQVNECHVMRLLTDVLRISLEKPRGSPIFETSIWGQSLN